MLLGRLDGICFVGLDLGQLLCGGGYREEGLPILERSRDGFRQLGQTDLASQTQALIDRIRASPAPAAGPPDQPEAQA